MDGSGRRVHGQVAKGPPQQDSFVTVNEKLDASAFGIEKDPLTGNVLYYKRNTEAPISKIDRTLMRYYERPISHFDGLKEEVRSTLPPARTLRPSSCELWTPA